MTGQVILYVQAPGDVHLYAGHPTEGRMSIINISSTRKTQRPGIVLTSSQERRKIHLQCVPAFQSST